jgi:hypothetical protein
MIDPPARQSGADPAADRRRGKFRGRVDLVRMKAIYWDDGNPGHEVRVSRDSGRAEGERPKSWHAEDDRGGGRADDELMHKYLDGKRPSEDEIKRGLRKAHHQERDRAVHVRLGVQEQGRAGRCSMRHRVSAPPLDMPPSRASDEDGEPITRKATTTSRSRRWRSRS